MSDTEALKATIVQSVLDRKFSKANIEFANLMRDKAYSAIDDYKRAFKYVSVVKKDPEESKPETTKKESEKKDTKKEK